nr:MAG TPA: NUC130/3NT domain protein [Caudoviricetes sp.]
MVIPPSLNRMRRDIRPKLAAVSPCYPQDLRMIADDNRR